MTHSKGIKAVALGAGGIKLAEFSANEAGRLTLRRFVSQSFSGERISEARREQETIAFLREAQVSGPANFCVTGQQAFTKFVKLPPVDAHKLRQIIEYEARQQVPYPIEQAIWDFQIFGEGEVLLAAMKAESAEGIFRAADASGLRVEVMDAPIAALANAFLYNYSEVEGCSLLVDIGAKTTNVLLIENGRFFGRSLNLGSSNITQEFGAETKLPAARAEQFKLEHGFVGLGGAYEDHDDPRIDALSKIARQVMTRLHAQILQTIQFYRSQQGGSAPRRIYLAGGGSLMPYTGQFFAEKFELAVERFNPLRNLEVDDSVAPEAATHLGELVGVALREIAKCPVELNLMPKSIRQKQDFRRKRPYFVATFLALIAGLGAHGYFYSEVASMKRDVLADLRSQLEPLKARTAVLDRTDKAIKEAKTEVDVYTKYLQNRFFWAEGLVEMRNLLIAAEEKMDQPGRPVGVWIEEFGAVPQEVLEDEGLYSLEKPVIQTNPFLNMPPEYLQRYFPQVYEMMRKSGMLKQWRAPLAAPKANTNLLTIAVKFRAMSLATPTEPAANSELAYLVEKQFQDSPIFDRAGTKLEGNLENSNIEDENFGTFGFGMTLKLKNDLQM